MIYRKLDITYTGYNDTTHTGFNATEWMLKNPKGRANSVQLLGFSGTVKENA